MTLDAQTREGRRLILAGCFILLALLGWLDYLTGYEMSFFVFYSVPVGLAAWFVGRGAAIVLALAATMTWLVADFCGGAKYSAAFFYYWNGSIHFLAFIINAVTVAKIKSDLDRRQLMAAELEDTKAKLRAFAAALPRCPICGKSRESANAQGVRAVGAIVLGTELGTAFCPDCRDSLAAPDPGEDVLKPGERLAGPR